jgi:hypothetical protein
LVGLISIAIFLVWLKYYNKKRKETIETETTEADFGYESDEGSREDYLRAYQSDSQRLPYGNGQDSNGYRDSLRAWD